MISFMGSAIGSPCASVPNAKFCSTLHKSLMPLRNFLRQLSTMWMCKEYYKGRDDMQGGKGFVKDQNVIITYGQDDGQLQTYSTKLLLVLWHSLDVTS